MRYVVLKENAGVALEFQEIILDCRLNGEFLSLGLVLTNCLVKIFGAL